MITNSVCGYTGAHNAFQFLLHNLERETSIHSSLSFLYRMSNHKLIVITTTSRMMRAATVSGVHGGCLTAE